MGAWLQIARSHAVQVWRSTALPAWLGLGLYAGLVLVQDVPFLRLQGVPFFRDAARFATILVVFAGVAAWTLTAPRGVRSTWNVAALHAAIVAGVLVGVVGLVLPPLALGLLASVVFGQAYISEALEVVGAQSALVALGAAPFATAIVAAFETAWARLWAWALLLLGSLGVWGVGVPIPLDSLFAAADPDAMFDAGTWLPCLSASLSGFLISCALARRGFPAS